MAKFKVGDKVKVKARKDWPTPPGYRMANAEGTVDTWVDWDEAMGPFDEYVYVKIDKAEGEGKVYIGQTMFFREDNLKKI